MELQGKRLVFLGDSLTEGAGSSAPDKRYWEQVAKQTGAVCFADGQGGTQIAPQQHPRPETEAPYLYHPFIDRVSSLPEQADVVVVFGGVNDFFQGDAPVGNMTDRTPDTFYGALHVLYTRLIERYPTARIIVMTPLHFEREAPVVKDGREVTLREYVGIIREVAEEYSLPVLDMYATSGIQPKIVAQKEAFITADGVHPHDGGYARIAECLTAFLKRI